MTYALATLGAALIAGLLAWAAARRTADAHVKAAELTAAVAKAANVEIADAAKAKANQSDLDNLRDWYRDAFAEVTARLQAAERRAEAAGLRADAAAKDRRHAEDRAERAEAKAEETERRCDAIERKMELLVPYVAAMKAQIIREGGNPPPTPRDLIPPLD